MPKKPQARSFGAWVLERRKAYGLSRRDVAQKVGVSSEYIRLIEASLRQPSPPLRFALRTLLNEEELLADLIYANMPWDGEHYQAVADQIAAKIVKAGYRKFVV